MFAYSALQHITSATENRVRHEQKRAFVMMASPVQLFSRPGAHPAASCLEAGNSAAQGQSVSTHFTVCDVANLRLMQD